MEKEFGAVCTGGLSFFGKTCRVISHELKNVLAIISETSGLMQELVELSQEGMELTPGKLQSLSESIIEEVERANDIIRSMNRFGHGVDEFIGEVDLGEAVTLMVKLTRMDAPLKKAKVLFQPEDRHPAYTSLFFAQKLIYDAIVYASTAVDANNEIHIRIESDADWVHIAFSGISAGMGERFPTGKTEVIAKLLGVNVQAPAGGQIQIQFPRKFDPGILQLLPPSA